MKHVFLLIIVFGLVACGKKSPAPENPAQIEKKAIAVRTAPANLKSVAESLTLYGETAPLWSVKVFPNGAGKIIEKNNNIGDRVERGTILAKIIQDIPGMDFSPSAIEAPVAGIITSCRIEIGSEAGPQQPVYEISNLDSIKINARVLESQLSAIKQGSTCRISGEAFPEQTIKARVSKIYPQMDAQSKTAIAEMCVDNSRGLLMPGMTVRCEFRTRTVEAVTVPLDAIVRSGLRASLYKVIDGKARFISVQLGKIDGAEVVVKGDVSDGDLVVVYGQNFLQDGAAVRIVNESNIPATSKN